MGVGDLIFQTGCKDQSRVGCGWEGWLTADRSPLQADSDNLWQRHRLRGGGGWDRRGGGGGGWWGGVGLDVRGGEGE